MKDNAVFWDASAIVPLCLHQPASPRARQILRQHPEIRVWWATLAEVRSAFARAVRVGRADADEHLHAIRRLQQIGNAWREIDPENAVRVLALPLLDAYSLRTGDALQLAAALYWCDGNPRRRIFVCFDYRLAEAAAAAGFTVITS